MRGQNAALIGLRTHSAASGPLEAPTLVRTSKPREGDLSRHLSRRVLGVKAAADYIGVSIRSLWRLVDADHLHTIRLPGVRRVGFDVLELDRLIEAGRE